MGATLNKISAFARDESVATQNLRPLSSNDIKSEFNELYCQSRKKLHSITDVSRLQLLENIALCLQQHHSKSLDVCFDGIDACRYGIMDMVSGRLSVPSGRNNDPSTDYNIPSPDYVNVDEYIKSNNIIECDSSKPSPQAVDTLLPKMGNDSLEVGGDVMQTMISMEFLE